MRRAPLLAALLLAVVGVARSPRSVRADDPPAKPLAGTSSLTAADREFFAWWDARGFPDVGKLPFVKVWTGMWSQLGSHDPVPAIEAGFLLREDGKKFTAFLTDLQTVTLEAMSPSDEKEKHQRVGIERTDLEGYVRAGLDALSKEGREIPWFSKSDPFGAHRWSIPNQAFRIAVLGRALAARGLDELAHTLCDRALHEATRPMRTEQYGDDDPSPRASYSSIEAEIKSEARVVLQAKFLDSSLSWDDLLAAHEAWARAFAPESLTEADGGIAMLRRMAEEARARKKNPPKPLEEQSPAERIATLVHDLQDVNAQFYDTWGLYPGDDEKEPKAAHVRLVELGFQAVPALIEALDDERYTRTMESYETFHGQYRSSSSVLHVGEMAWRILDKISGGALRAANAGGPPTSGRPTRRRAAEAWFETVKSRGEKTLLAEQVSKGDRASREAADRLVKIDPEAAVKPLETGILAGDEHSGRENLVYVLVSLKSEAATAAMLRLLEPLRASGPGITTASALWARGRREGLGALLRWWKDQAVAKDDGPTSRFAFGGFGSGDLIGALAGTGQVDAVRALGEGLDARSANDRVSIVTAFTPRDASGYREPYEKAASAEAEAAIEALLAERLPDGEPATGLHMGEEPIGDEPIVGEMAAWTLARRYPARWKFDPKGSAADRQAARLALADAWRSAHGKPPLAPPRGAMVEPVAPERAKPLVAAWLAAGDDDEARATAEAAMLEAGLGVLPHLRAARDALAAADVRRKELDRFVRRFASVAREIRWSEKGPKPNSSVSAYVDGIRGKPITGAWITGLWRQVALDTPDGATGIDLTVTRAGDGTGAVLVLELTTGTVGWQGGDGGWILDGDGLELVDDDFLRDGQSWWHGARAPQVDERLLVPETKQIRMRWTIKRARG